MSARPRPLPSEDETLCRYAREVFNACALRDYDVVICDEQPNDPQALCTATVDYRRRTVELRYAAAVLDYPEELREATAHEAVHTHIHALAEAVHEEVGTELGRTAFRVFWRSFERDLEQTTDALTGVIARGLPLIGEEG